MKITFKKLTASVMAVATMAVGAGSISASAEEITTPESPVIIDEYSGPTGYVSFGNGAEAGIYRDSGLVCLSTDGGNDNYVSVKLTSASYTTLSEPSGTTYDDTDGYVSRSYTGSGITSAHGHHCAGNYSVDTAR